MAFFLECVDSFLHPYLTIQSESNNRELYIELSFWCQVKILTIGFTILSFPGMYYKLA